MPYELRHKTDKKITPGRYFPLGANLSNNGVNFAIYSQHASEVFFFSLMLLIKSQQIL